MPYITRTDRAVYDDLIERIATLVKHVNSVGNTRNGHMNYIVSSLITKVYGPKKSAEPGSVQATWRYADINDVAGFLTCVNFEFYERVARPYERIKEEENGSVY